MVEWSCYTVCELDDGSFIGVWRTLKDCVAFLRESAYDPDDVEICFHDLDGAYPVDPDEYTVTGVAWADDEDLDERDE